MTKGIFLVAFGHPSYGRAAFNLAVSIKHYDPEIKIALLHDHLAFHKVACEYEIFDITIPLPESDLSQPAKIKTSIYKHLPFDCNLYLDVDALCLQSLTPLMDSLIESKKNYAVHIFETYDINSPDKLPWMYWAKRSVIWEQYKFDHTHKLPGTQSSIQWIKKSPQAELIFKTLNDTIENNPVPLDKLENKWGGGQPDELYLNITLAQLNIDADIGKNTILFANKILQKSFKEIETEYYIMSFFGGKNFARNMYKGYYDRKLITMCNARGYNHVFKIHTVLESKHADKRGNNGAKVNTALAPNRSAVNNKYNGSFPVSNNTLIIDSRKLLQKYATSNKRNLLVSNWLNCSAIEFKGKTYFCYRMESRPWCVHTRLAMCLLDEDYQPIKETNTLLNLHSDLRGFAKGYHVEDPRFFVFNDELFISYCDGYQMAQAKINPETLQAENSFYIKKPIKERTEKNWTFFEHNNKLFSVYSISPHVIYEMDGENFKTAHETDFKHNWKHGILRGGTSPILTHQGYLSFFHSSLDYKSRERQYFVGAYIFEPKPPFKITHISKHPLLSGEKVSNSIPRLSSKIYVVFPGGVIRKENSYDLFYGYNDFQCRKINITAETLKENLIEIVPEKELIETGSELINNF